MKEGSKLPSTLAVASLILDLFAIVVGWIGNDRGLPVSAVTVGFAMAPIAVVVGVTALLLGRRRPSIRRWAVIGTVLGLVLTGIGLFTLTWRP